MSESDSPNEKSIDCEKPAHCLQILGVDGDGYTHVHDADAGCVYVLAADATISTTERGIVVYRTIDADAEHVDDLQAVETGEFATYRRFVRQHRGEWAEWRVLDMSKVASPVDRVTGGC
jgi:hypothetical protein